MAFRQLVQAVRDSAHFDPEPRWPAFVAVVATGGIYESLPPQLEIVPAWWLLAVVGVLLLLSAGSHRANWPLFNEIAGYSLTIVMTVALIGSLALLIRALPAHLLPPSTLLRSAAALWSTNVIVFARWYWRLDAGGPNMRDRRIGHPDGAFWFPQMGMSREDRGRMGCENWSPNFVDYLFLAFNTSTALSPTDTSVLSRWAKLLMMLQAMISLTVIALLAARAVNIL